MYGSWQWPCLAALSLPTNSKFRLTSATMIDRIKAGEIPEAAGVEVHVVASGADFEVVDVVVVTEAVDTAVEPVQKMPILVQTPLCSEVETVKNSLLVLLIFFVRWYCNISTNQHLSVVEVFDDKLH